VTRPGGRGEDEGDDGWDEFGVEGEVRDAAEQEDEGDPPFAVWPENTRAVDLFLACRTQWRVGAMGGVFGLDYPGVDVVMNMNRVRNRRRTFSDLQVMEAAALPILNEPKE